MQWALERQALTELAVGLTAGERLVADLGNVLPTATVVP
jgi:hypothetical protein